MAPQTPVLARFMYDSGTRRVVAFILGTGLAYIHAPRKGGPQEVGANKMRSIASACVGRLMVHTQPDAVVAVVVVVFLDKVMMGC